MEDTDIGTIHFDIKIQVSNLLAMTKVMAAL
jgi:hypothetical protein